MWRLTAVLLVLVGAVAVAAAVWLNREPDGASIATRVLRNEDAWFDDLQSRNPKTVEAGSVALQQRGTAALPLIRRILQDPSAEPARRKAALKAAALLGGRSEEALPDVVALLGQHDYAPEAALALSFMGSAALKPLSEAASADDPAVRREALRSIGKLRDRASIDPQAVIPLLLAALKDADPSVRDIAVTYLGIVRDNPAEEVPGLIRALQDEEPVVRRAAATALASYGEHAEPAIPALQKATKDPDEGVQREAGRALVRIAELKQKM